MVDSAEIDAFIQSSPYLSWLASRNSECVYVNPALERLTGRNSDPLSRIH
jgi:PAS domain-containing protein